MKKYLFIAIIASILVSCKPDPEKPSVVTLPVTEITESAAVSGGNVTSDGGAEVTARGVCWSVNQNPTTTDNKTVDGNGTGAFTSNISELSDSTTYYIRAYATNSEGTSYGEEYSFTTLNIVDDNEGDDDNDDEDNGDDEVVVELPVVATTDVTGITETSAVAGGEITSDGGAEVTARGVCWSINQNPTTENDKTVDGSGVGSFTSNMTGLTQNTTYYVRAYAVNEMGVAYGEEVSFSTTSTEGTTNGHDWVDLGLPSGLKWATCNVGATAPEQYGDYYSWGEVETKTAYNSNNCSTMYQQIDDFSGDPQYDVARKKWGDAWRMPTKEEQEELLNNCTWELTTINGFSGYKVTGPNGNSIFLPAAGYYYDTYVNFDGYYGGYWSSTPHADTDSAYYLGFDDKEQRENAYYRSDGQSVRAVIE